MVASPFSPVEGSASGTTTNAYVVAATIEMTGYGNCLILIGNSSGAETMHYKVDSYANSAGTLTNAEKAETSIGASATASLVLDSKTRAKYVVSVKDNSGHCAYVIEHIKGN